MTEENFWLMKSEPDAYSIDTLKKELIAPYSISTVNQKSVSKV